MVVQPERPSRTVAGCGGPAASQATGPRVPAARPGLLRGGATVLQPERRTTRPGREPGHQQLECRTRQSHHAIQVTGLFGESGTTWHCWQAPGGGRQARELLRQPLSSRSDTVSWKAQGSGGGRRRGRRCTGPKLKDSKLATISAGGLFLAG